MVKTAKMAVGGVGATTLVGVAVSKYVSHRKTASNNVECEDNISASVPDFEQKATSSNEASKSKDPPTRPELLSFPDSEPKYSKFDLKKPSEWPEVNHGREWSKEFSPYLSTPTHKDLRKLVEKYHAGLEVWPWV